MYGDDGRRYKITPDGEVTVSESASRLPEGWPQELDPPEDADIKTSLGGKSPLLMNFESEELPSEMYEKYNTAMTRSGYNFTRNEQTGSSSWFISGTDRGLRVEAKIAPNILPGGAAGSGSGTEIWVYTS